MKWFYYFCKTLGIKIIWEMHNIVPHDCNKAGLNNSKWFYKMSDAIIYHSEVDIRRSKEIFEMDYDKKHIVIPHGHFNNIYENRISKKRLEHIRFA
jgi:hypothetical protein